ncbi:MAG: hypothetical protein EA385_00550 [Salinarimonadaceae bacterium]|nr:MAG: hypothetical protein EA385_00550 [Salinarimonadaceae bacterium]
MTRHSRLPPNLPPRLLGMEAAAAYCDVSAGTFLKMVDAGTMPPPKRIHGSRKGWCVRALDLAIDALPDDGPGGCDGWEDVDAA